MTVHEETSSHSSIESSKQADSVEEHSNSVQDIIVSESFCIQVQLLHPSEWKKDSPIESIEPLCSQFCEAGEEWQA